MKRIGIALALLGFITLTACEQKKNEPQSPPPEASNTTPPAPNYPPVDVEAAGAPRDSLRDSGAMEPVGRAEPRREPAPAEEELQPTRTSRAPKQAPRATQARTHTIRKGDTLSEIAERYYGDASKWQRIYQANKGKIKDPKKLQPGTKITIP